MVARKRNSIAAKVGSNLETQLERNLTFLINNHRRICNLWESTVKLHLH